MKDQAIQYLAFDVHQATCELSLRDASGSVVMRGTVPTEATAILRVVKGAGSRVHVAYEEGTQAQWLHGPDRTSRRAGDRVQPAWREKVREQE